MKKNITILVVAVIVALAVGVFGGMQYQKMAAKKIAAQFPGGQGFNRGNFTGSVNSQRSRNGAGFTAGSVLSKNDSKSFTVKLNSGGSEIVFLSANSKIMKSATGTIDDLVAGEQVVVSGTANSDGSITATSVQLGNSGFGGNRPAGAPDQGQAAPVPAK
ncbi:MAG: DUF5666 domain-containing protein [Patescibacteria group bacterium]|nr:DUF5666 domain-containing protein [Patescibacteria group bacterium]